MMIVCKTCGEAYDESDDYGFCPACGNLASNELEEYVPSPLVGFIIAAIIAGLVVGAGLTWLP